MPTRSKSKSRTRSNPKLAAHFCRCIKAVAPKFGGLVKGEGAAIAICVKSILQTKGRTLKRFRCKEGASITTQSRSKTKTKTGPASKTALSPSYARTKTRSHRN
jgi:hypothetical protein